MNPNVKSLVYIILGDGCNSECLQQPLTYCGGSVMVWHLISASDLVRFNKIMKAEK